jgi:hypothetical protein
MALPVITPDPPMNAHDVQGHVVAKAYKVMTSLDPTGLGEELGAAAGRDNPIGVVIHGGDAASLDSPSLLWVYDANVTDDTVISVVRAHNPDKTPEPVAEPVQR